MKSRILIAGLLLILFLGLYGCRLSPHTTTLVSGKTVHKGMGMENVLIAVYRLEPSGWQKQMETRSGYHGTFRFTATVGSYRLVARKELSVGRGKIPLEGIVNNLRIREGGGRIDRVVIDLKATI